MEPRKYYFIAGTPRSGSTLLSSILNQNPRIYSGPSSPVLPTMMRIRGYVLNNEYYKAFPKPHYPVNLCRQVIGSMYADITKPVIIDKNRAWTDDIGYITNYITNDVKIICPVRDMSEITASFLTLYKNNDPNANVEKQCEYVLNENNVVGAAYKSLKIAIDNFPQYIHLVDYNELVTNPQQTIDAIYDFLGEPRYTHDFTNIKNDYEVNDVDVYRFVGMHAIKPTLEKTSKDPKDVLPKEIYNRCQQYENLYERYKKRLLNDSFIIVQTNGLK